MPELQSNQEFFHTDDIENIAQEVGEHHIHPEHKDSQGKEIIKEIIQNKYELGKQTSPVQNLNTTKNPNLPDYMENATLQEKQEVEELITLTREKGIKKAIQKAKASHNPYIIDAFHDVLVDKIYEELVKKGVVKE